jgi:hypothetical protein
MLLLPQAPGSVCILTSASAPKGTIQAYLCATRTKPGQTVYATAETVSAVRAVGRMVVFSAGLRVDAKLLQDAFQVMSPGAILIVRGLPAGSGKAAKKQCLFAGFSKISIADLGPEDHVYAVKPEWKVGTSAAVETTALVDEDALLARAPVPEMKGEGKSGCDTKPKACANCSCGRKELEEKMGAEEAKKNLEEGGVRSSCGSCYLGDAYRCAGCPYRGQPAFKPGEKVTLDVDSDAAMGEVMAGSAGTDLLDLLREPQPLGCA